MQPDHSFYEGIEEEKFFFFFFKSSCRTKNIGWSVHNLTSYLGLWKMKCWPQQCKTMKKKRIKQIQVKHLLNMYFYNDI